jgi:hypothetical protein
MKSKYLILGILVLIVFIIGCTQQIGEFSEEKPVLEGEKQKTLLDNKEIYCNSSKEKAREVCLSHAVNQMGKSIAWAGIHLICEDNLCKVVN